MTFYTKKGDDGSTGLYYGGRERKDSSRVEAYGTVDEAQAFLGVPRAMLGGGRLADMLVGVQRDLYVLMAELATADENRHKLKVLVTEEAVEHIGSLTDQLSAEFEMPSEFVLPGQDPVSAALEVARTVVRRAERAAVGVAVEGSFVVPYLNRLSSLLWAMARWQEGQALFAKERP
jgi:cob(I)alamin adenosyltransferase